MATPPTRAHAGKKGAFGVERRRRLHPVNQRKPRPVTGEPSRAACPCKGKVSKSSARAGTVFMQGVLLVGIGMCHVLLCKKKASSKH